MEPYRIGIYGKSLDSGECLEIHQVEPYIFDEGLALLFLFHGEKADNFLGEGTLLLHEDVEIVLAEGTIYEEKIEPHFYQEKGIKRMLRTANMVIHVLCGEPRTSGELKRMKKIR